MEPVIGSTRLFDAFEQMGQSQGADLRSAFGPSGAPAGDLVHAFDEAMASPGAAQRTENAGSATAYDGAASVQNGIETPGAPVVPGPAESFRIDGATMRIDRTAGRIEGTARTEAPEWNNHGSTSVNDVETLFSPVELYQAQYQIGLVKAHVTMGMQSSRNLTQSLETTLKQSG